MVVTGMCVERCRPRVAIEREIGANHGPSLCSTGAPTVFNVLIADTFVINGLVEGAQQQRHGLYPPTRALPHLPNLAGCRLFDVLPMRNILAPRARTQERTAHPSGRRGLPVWRLRVPVLRGRSNL